MIARTTRPINSSVICTEKVRGQVVTDEMIEPAGEMCDIKDETFHLDRQRDCNGSDTRNRSNCDKEEFKEDEHRAPSISLLPLRPFASEKEIEQHEYEKERASVYDKFNMFYVPSFEDSPQHLPRIASVREHSPVISTLQKSLHRDSFTYNSWLQKNNYNNSKDHVHIVDPDDIDSCDKEADTTTPDYLHTRHIISHPITTTSTLPPRRISEVPVHRRPSIAQDKHKSLLKRSEYTWIEGVHIKSKISDDLSCLHSGSEVKCAERSPGQCDERMFTFKARPTPAAAQN